MRLSGQGWPTFFLHANRHRLNQTATPHLASQSGSRAITGLNAAQQACRLLSPDPIARRNFPSDRQSIRRLAQCQKNSRLVQPKRIAVRIVAQPLGDRIERSSRALGIE